MSNKRYYITTPLYYVNAKPHIGHAYTNVICDTFARFHKWIGEDVFFMTGTDEHGSKIAQTARERNLEPKQYVDSMIPHFEALWKTLNIQYDFFFRTTSAFHQSAVHRILADLEAQGEIYRATYEGWYSIKSETFYSESELVNGRCPDTGGEVQKIQEENYFLRISKYQEWLIQYINDHPGFIQPEIRRNEILGFLKQPLEDLCITRPRKRLEWGIPYPNSAEHVIYVWFDALINYVSGAGYKLDDPKFNNLWPADVHVIGKDIIRHHAVYWPIMLKACGLEMPHKILAHGWWTLGGAKVSKSSGNSVDPLELVNKYGTDAFRFFLLREVTLGMDGAFSEDLLRERYTSDLANDLGNLWFRFASMVGKYFNARIPEFDQADLSMAGKDFEGLYASVRAAMLDYDPRTALNHIWDALRQLNNFIEESKPWQLAKDPDKRENLANMLGKLGEWLAHISVMLLPFLPDTSRKILDRLQLKSERVVSQNKEFVVAMLTPGTEVFRGDVLFPRIDDEEKNLASA